MVCIIPSLRIVASRGKTPIANLDISSIERDAFEEIIGLPQSYFAAHTRNVDTFDPMAVCVAMALRVAAQRMENIIAVWLAPAGLTVSKFNLLNLLLAEDEAVALSELRRTLLTTQANITGLVHGLERDGLVERVTDPDDRRVSLITISRKGRRLMKSLMPEHFRRVGEAAGQLSKEEQRRLIDMLARTARGFERVKTKSLARRRSSRANGAAR